MTDAWKWIEQIPAETMDAWRKQMGLDREYPISPGMQAIIDAECEDHFNRTVRPHLVPGPVRPQ